MLRVWRFVFFFFSYSYFLVRSFFLHHLSLTPFDSFITVHGQVQNMHEHVLELLEMVCVSRRLHVRLLQNLFVLTPGLNAYTSYRRVHVYVSV
jgi:hypothetical protein